MRTLNALSHLGTHFCAHLSSVRTSRFGGKPTAVIFTPLVTVCILLMLLTLSGWPAISLADDDSGSADNQKLQQLREQIQSLRSELDSDQQRKQDLQSRLRHTERHIGKVVALLKRLEHQLRTQKRELSKLNSRRSQLQSDLNTHRVELARQIRAAYAIGQQEYVKILLNQQDPATVGREQLQSLEARIEQLENRMTTIGVMDQALEKFNRQEEELNRLGQRFNRLESTVTTQIDQILKDIVALHQKAAQPPAAGTQPAQPVEKIKPAASKPKEAASQYHQVQPGETLYRIGRRYGLTVEQLRSYNKLASNAAIYPGQKLKLSPDAKQ